VFCVEKKCVFIATFVVVLVGVFLGVKKMVVKASSSVLTSQAEFETGYFNGTESVSKTGEIKINPSGTWGARVFKSPKIGLSSQSPVTSDGKYVYVMGNADRYFARYLPTEDRWQQLANAPHAPGIGSDMVVLGDYIYAIFGGYFKEFSRYSISRNTWENLSNAPDLIGDGGSIATDGTFLYVTRGWSTTDFWRYNPNTGAWLTTLSIPPAGLNRGVSLMYYNGYLYTPRGDSLSFYQYNINLNVWSTMPNIPGAVTYSSHNSDVLGTNIYYVADYGTTGFYKFDLGTTSWSTLSNTPWPVSYVGLVANSSENKVYVFRGGGTFDFWKYDPDSGQYLGLPDLTGGSSTGGDLIYDNGNIFAVRGSNTVTQYRYTVGSTWVTMADAPAQFNDDTKGIKAGAYHYYVRGSGTTSFWRYDPSVGVGGTWAIMLGTPATMNYGAALVYPGSGDYLYGTRGGLTRTFYRYKIGVGETWEDAAATDLPDDAEAGYGSRMVSDGTDIYYIGGSTISKFMKYSVGTTTWSSLGNVPFTPYYGTDMSYYNGKIYFLAGYYKRDMWEYTIAGGSWRWLGQTQSYGSTEIGPYAGAALENDGAGTFYITLGNGYQRLLTYTVDSNKYLSSGQWTSSTLDLTYVANWESMVLGTSAPGDSSINWNTRTSSDGTSWNNWINGVGNSIGSLPGRYLQIGVTLNASSDRSQTPVVYSLVTNYVGDTGVPQNPTTISALSQQVAGVGLTSGGSYSYLFPYFSWSGATDAETNVGGYYVYFGGSETADPGVNGSYQTGSSYTVRQEMNQQNYYLRIKTIDGVGNTSAATTLFNYVYAGVAPPVLNIQTSTVDFSLGTTGAVSIVNDQIKLQSKSGFWGEERLGYLYQGVYYGSRFAYAGGKLYMFRGYNTNTFFSYDLANNVSLVSSTAPATVYYGGDLTEGPEGFLYGLRGNNTNSFWRFNIGTTTWSDGDAADLPTTAYYGAVLQYDGSRYIYAFRGNSDDAFYRYDTQMDSWEQMANVDFGAPDFQPNNFVYDGGDLAITGDGTIFAIQGNSRNGFASYDSSSNSWTRLANLPMLANYGAQIEYDASSNALYFLPGIAKTYFWKYSLDDQTWTELPETPLPVYAGASLKNVNGNLYMAVGNGGQQVYQFDIQNNVWIVPTVGLFDGWWRGSDSRTFGYGADIIKGEGENYYLTRGNYDNLFIKYNALTGEKIKLADAPAGFYLGGSLVYDNVRQKIYATPSSYFRKLFVYDIATDTWSEETDDPPPFDSAEGSVMKFDGSRYIYWVRGGGTQSFYRFDTLGVGTSKWKVMPITLGSMSYGADMVIKNNYLYAIRGSNVGGFYRLDLGTTIWSDVAVADLPTGGAVYNDGFLVDIGGNNLMAVRGANTTAAYIYSITSGLWSTVPPIATAPYIYTGGAGAVNSDQTKVLVIAGTTTGNTFANGLYSWIISSENSAFESSGTYISPVIDLASVYQYANLTIGKTEPVNTLVEAYTRSSADNIDWSEWVEVGNEKRIGTESEYKINSTANRYLQTKVVLTSSDGVRSPMVYDLVINYYQDIDPPTNPTDLGTTMVSGVWNNSTAPYFSWSGADDGVEGSGVKGYYVYFGGTAVADPVTYGTYTTGTSFVSTGLTSGNTYYFRMKTIDNANNVTTGVGTTFVYKFDSGLPTNSSTLVVNPPGYTATNSFNFSWTEAEDSASGISLYCYKTAAVGSTDTCTTDLGVSGITSYRTGTNTFYVRAKDTAGNYTSDYITGSYYYSSTSPGAPRNLSVGRSSNTVNEFSFSWEPPEVYYGQQSGLRYYYSINSFPKANNVNSVGLAVTYLSSGAYATQKGENTLYVVAKDEAGNIDYNSYAEISFFAETQSPGIPSELDISDVSIKETKSWRLALSWETPSSTGSGVSAYKVYRSETATTCSSSMSSYAYVASTTQTSYVDTGLTQTKKYYCVKACDSTNECSAPSGTVSLSPDGKWRVASTLTSGPEVEVKTKSAEVAWSTNRTSNSFVKYGKTSGSYGDEVGSSDQVSSHTISMTGLDPGTAYYYKVLWTDEDGNTGESSEKTLTTNPAPVVGLVKVSDVGLHSVYVNFSLSNATKATIQYGLTTEYGSLQEITTSTSESIYTIKLDNLDDGTIYHLRILAEDEESNAFYSDDYQFETLPVPKISESKVQQVKGASTATIRLVWKSNTEVSSVVTFFPKGRSEASKDQIQLTLTKNHQMIIKDLTDDTDYVLAIKGKDVGGNEAESAIINFKTSTDLRSPEISNLKVEGVVVGVGEGAKASIVVNWDTDEAAGAQLEYGEGTGSDYPNRTQEDTRLTANHIVTITDLKPATVYHLRVVTKDRVGNVANSYDNVIVTPKATKSAMDLVVGSLSKSFGFLNNLGGVSR
jgi:hypothetical protein